MLDTKNEYYVWNKKDADLERTLYLSRDFHIKEFTCPCTNKECIDQKIAQGLITRLQSMRNDLKEAIQVTSGYRCHAHQVELAEKGCETAKGISQHELGNAADIKSSSMLELRSLVKEYFEAIGFSPRFLHVDLRADKIRHWYYKK